MALFSSILSARSLRAARSAAKQRDWAAAAGHYRHVLRIDPGLYRSWIQLGHALKENGELAGAEAAYGRAIIAQPNRPDGYRELGFFLRRMERYAEARLVIAAGLVVAPAAQGLADELAQLGVGETQSAHKVRLGALIVRAMKDRHVVRAKTSWLLRAARRAARSRRWERAVHHYEALSRRDPADGTILVQMGHALKEYGDGARALSAYRQAVAADPLLPDAHLQLAHALVRFEGGNDAPTFYASALKLDPSLADAWRGLTDFGIDNGAAEQLIDEAWFDPQRVLASQLRRIESVMAPLTGDTFVLGHQAIVPPQHLTVRERQIWLDLAQNLVIHG